MRSCHGRVASHHHGADAHHRGGASLGDRVHEAEDGEHVGSDTESVWHIRRGYDVPDRIQQDAKPQQRAQGDTTVPAARGGQRGIDLKQKAKGFNYWSSGEIKSVLMIDIEYIAPKPEKSRPGHNPRLWPFAW